MMEAEFRDFQRARTDAGLAPLTVGDVEDKHKVTHADADAPTKIHADTRSSVHLRMSIKLDAHTHTHTHAHTRTLPCTHTHTTMLSRVHSRVHP